MTETNLHQMLVHVLPAFVREPFSENPRLDVPKLSSALGMSGEGVWKWLREDRISPKGARSIVNVAVTDNNQRALSVLNRAAPKVEDFSRFVFA